MSSASSSTASTLSSDASTVTVAREQVARERVASPLTPASSRESAGRAGQLTVGANQPLDGIPWFVVCAAVAIASSTFGVQWDIAWHRSIGRDTLFSPPHIFIYLGGILAGLTSGFIILQRTFSKNHPQRNASVRIWG